MIVVVALSLLLMRGIRESSTVNSIIVVIKVTIVIVFVAVGIFYVKSANYVPFIPDNTGTFGEFGFSGIMRGAAVIFFAYIGFDAVSTAAQEAKDPQRAMPIGIIGSLLICTVLYVAFAFVLTGMVNYHDMKGDAAPVATAIDMTPYGWLQIMIKLGVIAGFTSVILVMLLGQSRVFYSMAEDGLLPRLFAAIHPRWQTPWRSNLVFMVIISLFAGFIPISKLGHMTSIGTLLAFIIVCAGIIVLRYKDPRRKRPFRAPFVPLVPLLGILVCLAMMVFLNGETWLRLIIWLLIGFAIYFGYSRTHSRRQLAELAAAGKTG
jgi:APA family basic amino acid/polyamine antiporter